MKRVLSWAILVKISMPFSHATRQNYARIGLLTKSEVALSAHCLSFNCKFLQGTVCYLLQAQLETANS